MISARPLKSSSRLSSLLITLPIYEGIVEHLPHAPFATPGSRGGMFGWVVAQVASQKMFVGFRPTRTASKSSAKARRPELTLRHRNVEKPSHEPAAVAPPRQLALQHL
jgi:hypothetical protein